MSPLGKIIADRTKKNENKKEYPEVITVLEAPEKEQIHALLELGEIQYTDMMQLNQAIKLSPKKNAEIIRNAHIVISNINGANGKKLESVVSKDTAIIHVQGMKFRGTKTELLKKIETWFNGSSFSFTVN
jgi:hypothetical protein